MFMNTRKYYKQFLIILFVSLLLYLFFLLYNFNLFGECKNNKIKTIKSPNGDYFSILFSRDCGATTKTSTHIIILSDTSNFNNKLIGNIFIYNGIINVKMIWENQKELHIYTNNINDIKDLFEMKLKYKTIKIIYN